MLRFSNHVDADLAGRFMRPLCFAAPGDAHYGLKVFEIVIGSGRRERLLSLGLQGSCTLIQYRDRHFVLFTRHQIAEIPNENLEKFRARMELLYVLMDDGRDSTNLPIANLLFSFDGEEGDDEDDFVIGIVQTTMMTQFMRDQFFPVDRTHTGRVGDRGLAAGFLSHQQQVLMQQDGLRIQLSCKSGQVVSRSNGSVGLIKYQNDNEPLDGISGGPVLLLRPDMSKPAGESFIAFVDGIIQRGGNGHLRYLTIERILDKLDGRVFWRPRGQFRR